ncbi:hypothetical protein [Alienimonas sp. DA493]|uniref:hypothetical protein n=1 Tax=Alienimonas sp. DA493 TaxID=3373605 RepID=UPI0037546657
MPATLHKPTAQTGAADAEWGYEIFCEGALSVPSAMAFADCGKTSIYAWAKLPPGEGIRMSNTRNGRNARVCKRSLREFLAARQR